MTRWDEEVDLACIGGGAGSLIAAIIATEAGLNAKILEKSSRIGGGAAYSGAVLWAPNNLVMKRKHWPDSVDEAVTYLDAIGFGRSDLTLARAYAETVNEVIDFIVDRTPLVFINWPGQPDHYPNLPGAKLEGRQLIPHPRAAVEALTPFEADHPEMKLVRESPHMDLDLDLKRFSGDRSPGEAWVGGRALIGGLWKTAIELGVPLEVNTPATDLIVEDGVVVGVEVEQGGEKKRIRARGGVLLNTGGFDQNPELNKRYLFGASAIKALTPHSLTGDGLIMAQKLGAATALMDQCMLNIGTRIPGEEHPDGGELYRIYDAELAKPHGIVVNRAGRRFANESAYYCLGEGWLEFDPRVREFENLPSYAIFDQQFRENYGLPHTGIDDPVPDWIVTADTLEELARKRGINPDGLLQQVNEYNAMVDAGKDTQFGRGESAYDRIWGDKTVEPNPTMGRIEKGPFYSIEVYPASAGNRGGVVINEQAEVVTVTGEIIPGLYACGNVAAQLIIGQAYASGIAIGSSLTFGYIAAHEVADKLGVEAQTAVAQPGYTS
jgi:3-oxosteroid 1-dehydrogenase